jgi:hypothetical protein
LTQGGFRFFSGSVDYVGSLTNDFGEGRYWSSTIATFTTGAAMHLKITQGRTGDLAGSAGMFGFGKSYGFSVRCIKN